MVMTSKRQHTHAPSPKGWIAGSHILVTTAGGLLAALLVNQPAQAHNNKVSIKVDSGQRCIYSNGLPNHATGQFPNAGNPNRLREQSVKLCITTSPRKGDQARQVRGSIGVGINGVQFRPGTADYYDPSSRRGFSRNPSSGWKLDGLGAASTLGMDANNAHVDERGLYHYHGIANALVKSGKGSLIGWAADGFEIHYVGSAVKSGYRLKKGARSNPPGGNYDGTYVQDWSFVAGTGSLDQCNGGMLKGKFVYFATDTYPFLPHCLWGNVSKDFLQRAGGGKRPKNARNGRPRQVALRGNRRPPKEALAACRGKDAGQSCSFVGRRQDMLTGLCRTVRTGANACVPDNHRRP